MTDDSAPDGRRSAIDPGALVYDEDGDLLGVVSSVTEDGIEVVAPDDAEGDPATVPDDTSAGPRHEDLPGQEFGEGYLVWRCDECGEMGDVDGGMPDECPNCGARKNALYRIRED